MLGKKRAATTVAGVNLTGLLARIELSEVSAIQAEMASQQPGLWQHLLHEAAASTVKEDLAAVAPSHRALTIHFFT